MKKATTFNCFIIGPIGEAGTKTRTDADDLLSLIIKPALEVYGFSIQRGDHRSEPNQIDIDVIQSVQEADLCVVDISQNNPNVYYELGRRDETGKPRILLRSREAENIPVDIATQRYIEFDLDSRHGIRDAIQQIRNFVDPMIVSGFDSRTSGASLADLATILGRIERKLDNVSKHASTNSSALPSWSQVVDKNATPQERFHLGIQTGNVPMFEQAADQLQYTEEHLAFLDYYAEFAATRGSSKYGQMLIDCAQEFMDSTMSFKKKVEYLGSLVSVCGQQDREEELRPLIESICDQLWQEHEGEENEIVAQIFNQRNRLYYGLYMNTRDEQWLDRAIQELLEAQQISQSNYLDFNLALCYEKKNQLEDARKYAMRAIEEGEEKAKSDAEHLELACRILRTLNDPQYPEVLERLQKVSPIKAALLQSQN